MKFYLFVTISVAICYHFSRVDARVASKVYSCPEPDSSIVCPYVGTFACTDFCKNAAAERHRDDVIQERTFPEPGTVVIQQRAWSITHYG